MHWQSCEFTDACQERQRRARTLKRLYKSNWKFWSLNCCRPGGKYIYIYISTLPEIWTYPTLKKAKSSTQKCRLVGDMLVSWRVYIWLVLSDEQMSKTWSFSYWMASKWATGWWLSTCQIYLPIMDPWDERHIYLHEWFRFCLMVNLGKHTIHGSYGYISWDSKGYDFHVAPVKTIVLLRIFK